MVVQVIREKINYRQLKQIAQENFGEMVKGVVDLKKKILALGGELHADAEAVLLKEGSKQEDLWGFNIYPDRPPAERIEYSSFINIRPSQGNRAMDIQDKNLKQRIGEVIGSLIEESYG